MAGTDEEETWCLGFWFDDLFLLRGGGGFGELGGFGGLRDLRGLGGLGTLPTCTTTVSTGGREAQCDTIVR